MSNSILNKIKLIKEKRDKKMKQVIMTIITKMKKKQILF